ncbi:MAG TPA: DUF6569 family protein, partial [Planctomycetota bacterium]|nr:DUF6569 family protein [Planctomycetota bacterium]
LKENLVVISEKASAQVNELEIENTSSKPLYVQVGDRLKGGRQDRIVGLSFVVPPHSGKQPVRSFCVEHDRWHAITSVRFGSTENGALAPQNVRASAMSGDQGEVWKGVAAQKSQASASLGAPNTNSSLNETLDSDAAKKASQTYVDALAGALQGTDDAVGIAFAVNGEVTEVDIYPGRSLLAKLYPRLLASYAYQAATTKKDAASAAVTVADVIRFLDDGDARSRRHDQVSGNECDIVDFDKKIMSRDAYDGHVIMNVTGK